MSISRSHGTLVTAIFVIYALFVQGWLLPMFGFVIGDGYGGRIAGIILLTIFVLETVGIWIKAPEIYARLKGENKEQSIHIFLVWMFHLVVMSFLLNFGLEGLGIHHDSSEFLYGFVMAIGLIREIVLLVRIIMSEGATKKHSGLNEIVADVFLTIFLCVGYTAIWETISANMQVELIMDDILLSVVYVGITMILFLIFFLPLRMMYVLEDFLTIRTKGDWMYWWFSILIAALAGVSPIF